MPKPRGKPAKKPGDGGALDAKQRALREEEERLQAEIAALQQRIIEAPRLAAEAERQRAAQFTEAPRQYIHGANLLDARQAQEAGPGRTVPAGKRRKPTVLRPEREAGWKMTFLLLAALAFLLCWALSLYFNFFN